jgi:hypothetical protein
MTSPRLAHTATLLPDGKVLIAGGFQNRLRTPAASAELYDPSTGAFTPTGNMTVPRAGHSATLLADGKVLIAGGAPDNDHVGKSALASAELYDPSTGTFTVTGNMTVAREFYHTATLLNNGKVLIAGGHNGSGTACMCYFLTSSEVYDPVTGLFSPTGDMTPTEASHTATVLSDGRVLSLVGAHNSMNPTLARSTAQARRRCH